MTLLTYSKTKLTQELMKKAEVIRAKSTDIQQKNSTITNATQIRLGIFMETTYALHQYRYTYLCKVN